MVVLESVVETHRAAVEVTPGPLEVPAGIGSLGRAKVSSRPDQPDPSRLFASSPPVTGICSVAGRRPIPGGLDPAADELLRGLVDGRRQLLMLSGLRIEMGNAMRQPAGELLAKASMRLSRAPRCTGHRSARSDVRPRGVEGDPTGMELS